MKATAVTAVQWLSQDKLARSGVPDDVQQQLQQQRDLLPQDFSTVASAEETGEHEADAAGKSVMRVRQQLAREQQYPADASGQAQLMDIMQQVVIFCRRVLTWAPVQQWCANPGCVNLSTLSEKTIINGAGKMCACRAVLYCCTDCQKGDWQHHKPACLRYRSSAPVCC